MIKEEHDIPGATYQRVVFLFANTFLLLTLCCVFCLMLIGLHGVDLTENEYMYAMDTIDRFYNCFFLLFNLARTPEFCLTLWCLLKIHFHKVTSADLAEQEKETRGELAKKPCNPHDAPSLLSYKGCKHFLNTFQPWIHYNDDPKPDNFPTFIHKIRSKNFIILFTTAHIISILTLIPVFVTVYFTSGPATRFLGTKLFIGFSAPTGFLSGIITEVVRVKVAKLMLENEKRHDAEFGIPNPINA